MTLDKDPGVARIEDILSLDDSDPVQEPFGTLEKQLAKTVLILVAVPVLAIPTLFQALGKSIYIALSLVFLYIFCLFFLIQYQFHYILWATERIQKCMNTNFV